MPLYVLVQLIPAWLRTEGVDLATIGLFTLATLPYAWKFLWAPFLDRFSFPFLGRRRGWMLVSQLLLLLCITQFGNVDPGDNLTITVRGVLLSAPTVVLLVFLTSIFGATQDIVLDAYRREMLLDDELGTGNSIFVNAYRVSSLIPGSLAFVLADLLPWSTVFWVVALFMSVGIITTLLIPETSNDQIAPRSVREAVIQPFTEFFNRGGVKSALLILSFMLFYKLGDNMAVALQTPFFIDIGFTLTEIGVIAKFVILGSTIVGALLGGLLMLRLSINRALWIFGFVQIISIFGYAALAKIGGNIYALVVATSLEYLGVGLGTVALLAFMAKQTNRRFTATQFALLTSLTAVPRSLANAATGFIVEAAGYFNFFLLCVVVAIPGMLLLLAVAPWSESEELSTH